MHALNLVSIERTCEIEYRNITQLFDFFYSFKQEDFPSLFFQYIIRIYKSNGCPIKRLGLPTNSGFRPTTNRVLYLL
jgi:hypothetical protein